MITVKLDDQDITDSLKSQYPLPDGNSGIYPDASAGKWYDLLRCIDKNDSLKNNFFSGGVHTLSITGANSPTFNAKILLKSTYTSRNS